MCKVHKMSFGRFFNYMILYNKRKKFANPLDLNGKNCYSNDRNPEQ